MTSKIIGCYNISTAPISMFSCAMFFDGAFIVINSTYYYIKFRMKNVLKFINTVYKNPNIMI